MNELEILVSSPPLSVRENVVAQTDRGTAIVVRAPQSERSQADIDIPESRLLRERGYEENIFRRAAATDQSNCHGWVFTGGQYWLNGESVEQILADNNYTEVTDPRPGDVVIYRNERGISHTGIVRYVAKGQIPLVESKWAWMGVFLHPVDKSPYDKDYTFYRSPRNGHVVAGIPQPTVQAAPADITD
jgi:cell wall-associated NlpC family hydrolase